METNDDILTVKTFFVSAEAEIARGLLESEGILAFVADQFANTLFPGSAGGFRLQVRSSDLERAKEVLERIS